MKKFIIAIALALMTLAPAYQASALPRPLNAEFRINHGSFVGPGSLLGTQVISNKVQLLKCTYSFAVQGGSSTAAIKLLGPDGAPCLLVKGSIVKDGMIDVITAPTSAGSATIAIGTGQAANDMKTATAVASYTATRIATVPVGDAAHAIKITADATATLTVAVAPLTSGKINVYYEYLLGD